MKITNEENDREKALRIQCLFQLRKSRIYDMSIGLGNQDVHSQFLDSYYGISFDLLYNIQKRLTAEYARHVYSNHVKRLKLRLEEKDLNPDDINLIHFLMKLDTETYSSEEGEGEGEGEGKKESEKEKENNIDNDIKFKDDELDKKLELDKIDNQWAYCGLYSALHFGQLQLKESMKKEFNCNENTFEALKKFAFNNYDRRRRTNKKKEEEEKLNMVKEYYPPSASIDNKPIVIQLKLTDENADEIIAKEKKRLKSEQEKKEREQREQEEEEKMKNIVTKEQMEIMKIKDMAIECIANTSSIFDALYYDELPRFKHNNNNGELEEEEKNKKELELEKRREKEGYYRIIGQPVGEKQIDNIIPSHSAYVGAYCSTLFLEKYLRLAEKFDDNHLRNLRVQAEEIVSHMIKGQWKDFI